MHTTATGPNGEVLRVEILDGSRAPAAKLLGQQHAPSPRRRPSRGLKPRRHRHRNPLAGTPDPAGLLLAHAPSIEVVAGALALSVLGYLVRRAGR